MTRNIFISAIISLIIVTLGLFAYDKYYAQKVYVFNLKGMVAKQQDLMIKGQVKKDDIEKQYDDLKRRIDALGNNAVVITSDVVLKGVEIEGY